MLLWQYAYMFVTLVCGTVAMVYFLRGAAETQKVLKSLKIEIGYRFDSALRRKQNRETARHINERRRLFFWSYVWGGPFLVLYTLMFFYVF